MRPLAALCRRSERRNSRWFRTLLTGCEKVVGVLKALLIVGLAVSLVGVLMIPSPGPGYLVLAFGVVISTGSGIVLRQQRH
jgi:hypothetical protein